MSTENDNEQMDKALVADDNATKTDLSQGADAPLDDGTSTIPVKADPFDARKAVFSKHRDIRGERLAAEAAEHPDVADTMRVIAEEAGQGSSRNELDRGSHIDTNRPDRVPGRQPEPVQDPVDTGAAGEGRVKVKVNGQEFDVPQSDVDAAGGITAYQKDRAASMRLQQVAQQEAKLRAEREQFERERASAGRNAPAISQPGTGRETPILGDGVGAGADVESKSAAIVADLYSGDTKRASAAVAQILAAQSAPAATLDPNEIARQAADLLKQQDAKPRPTPQDAARDIEYDELNAMMANDHADLLANPTLKQKAVAEFERLRADPSNASRRLVDLGREAAKIAKSSGNPRQAVLDRKQQLPPVNRGSQRHHVAEPQKLGYFEQQARARGKP